MEKETIHKQEKLERYDARGVQTLFKTLSRNHYNLLKMVDNKARIVLTVNSNLQLAINDLRTIQYGATSIFWIIL